MTVPLTLVEDTAERVSLAGERLRCACGKRHSGWHHIKGRDYASKHCLRCTLPLVQVFREMEDSLGVVRVHAVYGQERPITHVEECPLTKTEITCLRELAAGKTYKQIADALGKSTSTIRTHLGGIFKKLGVTDRARAVLHAEHRGWIATTPDPMADVDYEPDLPPLTPAQRAYLEAFDEYLRSGYDPSARLRMVERLGVVMDEVPHRKRRRQRAA